ncbi:MAG: Beta-ketoadipate enol-lactone hydrolase, partial [uncultured Solirubrobacteraceae bacterium]
ERAPLRAARRWRAAAADPGHERDPPELGRAVPGRARARLRRDRLRPPRDRQERPAGGGRALLDRRPRRRRGRAARPARARVRACARHLDGRHGRPGARAGAPRPAAHADARLHLRRRRGQCAHRPERVRATERVVADRRPRPDPARQLGDQRLAALRRRRGRVSGVPLGGARAPGLDEGDHGPAPGDLRPHHARPPGGPHRADARHPRRPGPDARGRQRPRDRGEDPEREARGPPGGRPPVLGRGAALLRAAHPRARAHGRSLL